jgi:hypothetical protein
MVLRQSGLAHSLANGPTSSVWRAIARANQARRAAYGASEKSHWQLFEEYDARDATAAYSELEWE